jgi:hypothetical protein
MEYRLILDTDIMSFHLIINEMISDNWIPQGGVSVVSDAMGVTYFQAMIKIM